MQRTKAWQRCFPHFWLEQLQMEEFGALEVDQELLLDKLTFKIRTEAACGWISESVAQDRK